MPTEQVALVAGANGISGRAIAELLAAREGWHVLSLSRRPAPLGAIGGTVAMDLTSREDCLAHAPALREVTHVFYAARSPQPSLAAETQVNAAMLGNLLDALDAAGAPLRHVDVVHGTKWYGSSHLAGYGMYRTPAREDDARHDPPNFYHLQQDLLAARGPARGWSWSAIRPHTVCGVTAGYPHNLALMLAVHATICRHLGLVLHFPGSQECWDSISQATDARLMARAMLWAATTPACANQAFNIVNSDFFRWRDLWPRIADCFGVEPGGVRTMPLADLMADKEPVWREIVARHRLRDTPFADLGRWSFADGPLRSGRDDMSSTVKARRYGFDGIIETDAMFAELFADMRRRRLIP